jgi:hypothetical protein
MKKTYTEDVPEKTIKTSDVKEKVIKAHTIRCPYDTKKIKNECCICHQPIAGTEETYLMRGNYCPQCSACTAEQNFNRNNNNPYEENQ